MWSTRIGHIATTKFLLEKGANIDLANKVAKDISVSIHKSTD